MFRLKRLAVAFCLASALPAQTPVPDLTPTQQPDLATLSGAVRTLRRGPTVSDETKAKVDKLTTEAQADGQNGEARRCYAQAYALLKGQPWDAYAWSLALRPDAVVADPALPFIVRLTQTFPAALKSAHDPQVRLSLTSENDKHKDNLGTFYLASRDLILQPLGMDATLAGKSDGAYTVAAEVADGGNVIASAAAPVQIVHGIITGRAATEKKLSQIAGHDSAKATVLYPYVIAETVNSGRRQFTTADFGSPFQPQPLYDFLKGLQTSAAVLKDLEAGKDPLYRAKGNQERYYWFGDAHEMMAYHVYTPLKWDGESKLPMVLVLHGNSRDQDYYFDRDDHILARMAEQHGYLVVCPMGFRPNAGWGSSSLSVRAPGAFAADPVRVKQGDLSEKDALNVLELVSKEYPIDASRIYLFGHSAGGAGTWYIGEKYADKWAAIAASAAATRPAGFPFDRLKGMPIMVCHGDQDDEVPVASSRNMVKAAKENGLDPQYVEVPGATHLTIVAIVEPKVFDFFDQHPHKNSN